MANRRKEPARSTPTKNAPTKGSGSSGSLSANKRINPRPFDLSDLDAPTNAFPIGAGSGSGSRGGRKGNARQSGSSYSNAAIEWHDDTDDNPVNNDIDDLSEDDLFEDPQSRRIVIPAWMLLVWFACATLLFTLAIAALVAALLFS